MKSLTVSILIILGVFWLFYALFMPPTMAKGYETYAIVFEANLKNWASEKVAEGKLTESDVQEIFPENGSLSSGGEIRYGNLREMVSGIVESSAPPAWPSAILVVVGLMAAFRLKVRGGENQ